MIVEIKNIDGYSYDNETKTVIRKQDGLVIPIKYNSKDGKKYFNEPEKTTGRNKKIYIEVEETKTENKDRQLTDNMLLDITNNGYIDSETYRMLKKLNDLSIESNNDWFYYNKVKLCNELKFTYQICDLILHKLTKLRFITIKQQYKRSGEFYYMYKVNTEFIFDWYGKNIIRDLLLYQYKNKITLFFDPCTYNRNSFSIDADQQGHLLITFDRLFGGLLPTFIKYLRNSNVVTAKASLYPDDDEYVIHFIFSHKGELIDYELQTYTEEDEHHEIIKNMFNGLKYFFNFVTIYLQDSK